MTQQLTRWSLGRGGWLVSLAIGIGCAGSASRENGSAGDGAYGTAYEGDGVQCGALICSGSQVCCIVALPSEASSMGPSGKCNQSCESVCADSCPDAGNGAPAMAGGPGAMPPGMTPGAAMSGSPAGPMSSDAMAGPAGPKM
jgi:hypothetical protein